MNERGKQFRQITRRFVLGVGAGNSSARDSSTLAAAIAEQARMIDDG